MPKQVFYNLLTSEINFPWPFNMGGKKKTSLFKYVYMVYNFPPISHYMAVGDTNWTAISEGSDLLLVRGKIEEEMRILKGTEDIKKRYEVSEESMVWAYLHAEVHFT